ncbi:hypothetical protein [Rhizobium sp. FKL33]|uniref:hypothetical protein n=1 Tax=Rhizobium sp. FKL33 TaxID=2562307 RepID=UPI0010BFB082|nr:hypothetical protein [Rhizobium sp. FKL33]
MLKYETFSSSIEPGSPHPSDPDVMPPPVWKPDPPVQEPEPDRLPDEDPSPNPDETRAPPRHV